MAANLYTHYYASAYYPSTKSTTTGRYTFIGADKGLSPTDAAKTIALWNKRAKDNTSVRYRYWL